MRSFILGLISCLNFNAYSESLVVEPLVVDYLNQYCISCHGPDKSKGDRVFHTMMSEENGRYKIDLKEDDNLVLLHEILDQLNLGEMPPDKKNVKMPDFKLSKQVVAWLTETLSKLDQKKVSQNMVLRRLNQDEYRNTMRELFGLGSLSFDPCSHFPADERSHGFANLGQKLNTTSSHFDYWFEAADKFLEMGVHFGELVKNEKIELKPEDWGYPSVVKRSEWMYRHMVPGKYLDIGAGKKQVSEHIGLATFPRKLSRRGGVLEAGYYRIVINAEAVRRLTHPYDPEMIPAKLEQPMQLSLYIAHNRLGLADGGAKYRKKIALWDLKDHQRENYEVEVWLEKGFIPFVNWDNGPGSSDWWMRNVLAKYHTDIEFKGKEGAMAWHIIGKDLVPGRTVSDVWQGPVIRLHTFTIQGPLPKTYHNKARRLYFSGVDSAEQVDVKKALEIFMTQAFRRPVSVNEVEPYEALAKKALSDLGYSHAEAIKTAMKAVLVSPEFLYHQQETSEDGKLSPFAFANRLSYALWSSKPDSELMRLSQSGELMKSEVLRMQLGRMLKHAKVKNFVDGFSTSWLRLDKLGSMPPSESKFLNYYQEGLEESMVGETLHFVDDHLRNNLPLSHFIDSKETFLNEALAEHYGIEGVKGSYFRKVVVPNLSQRGGLLGHASILTLTANGVETSPVTRGIWILESILGTPPPPPPPDVEPLDPDIRGAKSLKDRLRKHREVESCADCHQKIDPYGFPLEQFDPIGGFRESYAKHIFWRRQTRDKRVVPGMKVDASSELRSGDKLNGMQALRANLMKRKGQFAKMLTEKLLVYCSGREMTYKDQAEVERIATLKAVEKYGFKDLVVEVLMSDIIKHK